MDNTTLHIRILSPQKLIYEGQAYAVSSENAKGKFDILPYHANFITLVENKQIRIRPAKNSSKDQILNFNLPLAVISVAANTVNIYTNF